MLITIDDAAAMLGLRSRGSVYRKIKEGKLEVIDGPKGVLIESEGLRDRWAAITRHKGSHPLRSVAERTAVVKKATRSSAFDAGDVPDYEISRARTEYEKANLLELDRRKKEGELLVAAEVEQAMDMERAIVRSALLGAPSQYKAEMPELEAEQIERMREINVRIWGQIAELKFGGGDGEQNDA